MITISEGDKLLIHTGATGRVILRVEEVQVESGVGIPLATEFRLPFVHLDKRWYEATRRFGTYAYHPPAEDWNLESGGNTDFEEPLCAPFNGIVSGVYDYRGKIGGVVQIIGLTPARELVVWAGWHVRKIEVAPGDIVRIGQPICAIGNAHGVYYAHLHEQITVAGDLGVPSPRTYVSDTRYRWITPSEFYPAHGVDADLVARCAAYDGA